jgi:hypothetical protein
VPKLSLSKKIAKFFNRGVIDKAPSFYLSVTPAVKLNMPPPSEAETQRDQFNQQMAITRAQNDELRQANQYNLDMQWRSQILTTIMVFISFLGTMVAVAGVLVATQQKPPEVNAPGDLQPNEPPIN